MSKKNTLNFEDSLQELETLVSSLEKGELSLEESLKTFEKGIKLTRNCQQSLNDAEQKVQVLLEQDDQLSFETFDKDA